MAKLTKAAIVATPVDFHDPEEDPQCNSDPAVTALYFDGIKVLEGDWYHDKIDSQIDGFIRGVQFAGRAVARAATKTAHLAEAFEYDTPDKLSDAKIISSR